MHVILTLDIQNIKFHRNFILLEYINVLLRIDLTFFKKILFDLILFNLVFWKILKIKINSHWIIFFWMPT